MISIGKPRSWAIRGTKYRFETEDEARAYAKRYHRGVHRDVRLPTHRFIAGHAEPLIEGNETSPEAA